MTGAEPVAAGSAKASPPGWRKWTVRIVVGLAVGALLSWSAINLVHADPPLPLWAGQDLPAIPAAEDNGWNDLYQHPHLFQELDVGPVERAVGASLGRAPEAGPAAPEDLTEARRSLGQPDLLEAFATCEASLSRPAFVDDCPFDFSQSCPSVDVLECRRIAAFHVLDAASRHEWAQAVARGDILLAQSLAHLSSARSVLSMQIALQSARESLVLARQLTHWLRAAGATGLLAGLERRIRAFGVDPLDLNVALAGEYIRMLSGIERITRGEVDSGGGALPGFFFDPGATTAELNRIFAPVRAAREADVIPAVADKPYTAQLGWWVRNPVGKLYLDAVTLPRRHFETLLAERAALLEERSKLLTELGQGD